MQLKHIVLTSDLSPESMRPFAPIRDLAEQIGARVTILHTVVDLQLTPHGAPFAPALSSLHLEKDVKHAQLILEDQRAQLGADLDVSIEVIAAPDPAKAICSFAEANDADLIAISTHGHTGLRRLAVGSVAEQVLRRASVPVLSFQREA